MTDEPARPDTEHSITGDPYAFEGETFAKLVAFEQRRNDDRASLMVRQRVLDDVRATHATLDALGVESGLPITARLALLLRAERPVNEGPTIARSTFVSGTLENLVARHRGPSAFATAADATVPDSTEVLADLDQLDGEQLFAIFRRLDLLPEGVEKIEDVIHPSIPADAIPGLIADMVNAACSRALEAGKLSELAKAAREATS